MTKCQWKVNKKKNNKKNNANLCDCFFKMQKNNESKEYWDERRTHNAIMRHTSGNENVRRNCMDGPWGWTGLQTSQLRVPRSGQTQNCRRKKVNKNDTWQQRKIWMIEWLRLLMESRRKSDCMLAWQFQCGIFEVSKFCVRWHGSATETHFN